MGEFFGSIYCWLEDFFGIELAEYLWGESAPEQLSNMYIGIGLYHVVHFDSHSRLLLLRHQSSTS